MEGRKKPWTREKALKWLQEQPWLVGFNYIPSYACNSTEFWQNESFNLKIIDRELGWAEEIGYNSARVFLQYIVWKNNSERFEDNFEQFLKIADTHKISIMPTFFDDCALGEPIQLDPHLGKQREPIKGVGLSSWTPSPGLKLAHDPAERSLLKKYVQALIKKYKKDDRIVAWDLYNEPELVIPNTFPLLKDAFLWSREIEPKQPISASIWNREKNKMNLFIFSNSDLVNFHVFGNYIQLKDTIEFFLQMGRPLICTEWLARKFGSNFELDLPLFKKYKVGCYQFGLVNGRTQAHFPWGNQEGMGIDEESGWFQDLLHKDGTAYDPDEVKTIKNILKMK